MRGASIEIALFRPQEQEAVSQLILAGLEEHWGYLDRSKNPDLRNIAETYADGTFLVAWKDGQVVGTGAFLPRTEEVVEIVRMSVHQDFRRQGIGRQILQELCNRAYRAGYRKAILETTETWEGVIAFYKAFGFQVTHYESGDVYFTLDLEQFFERV